MFVPFWKFIDPGVTLLYPYKQRRKRRIRDRRGVTGIAHNLCILGISIRSNKELRSLKLRLFGNRQLECYAYGKQT